MSVMVAVSMILVILVMILVILVMVVVSMILVYRYGVSCVSVRGTSTALPAGQAPINGTINGTITLKTPLVPLVPLVLLVLLVWL
jgi:hypothetical protein